MAPAGLTSGGAPSVRGLRLLTVARTALTAALTVAVTVAGPAASAVQPPAAAAATATAIQVHYGQLGGAGGFLGAQTTGGTGLPDGAYAGYRNGVIYYSPATGAWEVHARCWGPGPPSVPRTARWATR